MLSSGLPPFSDSVRSRRVRAAPLLPLRACGGKDCLAHENERLISEDDENGELDDDDDDEEEDVGDIGDVA
jgi:hypothetical protein